MNAERHLTKEYLEFIELLNSHGVDYLIAGGLGVLFHLKSRMIDDLDIVVRCSAGNADKLEQVITAFGSGNTGPRLTSQEFLQSTYLIRLGYKPNRVDLLIDPSPISFDEAWQRRASCKFQGVRMHFLDRDDVIERNRLGARPREDFEQRFERENGFLNPSHEPELLSRKGADPDKDPSWQPSHERDLADPDDYDFDL